MKKKIFKIDMNSMVKGTSAGAGKGYWVCTTTPNHPGKKLKDHKKTYVYYHVALKELEIGRFCEPWEEVHHKDGDSSNNDLSNLVLSDKREHQRQHSKKNHFWKTSPKNKPKKASVLRVVTAYIGRFL